MKIKILYILSSINGGGVGKILLSYLKNLNRSFFSIDVACLDNSFDDILFLDEYRKYSNKVYFLNKNYFKRLLQYEKLLRNHHYDIVHVHMEEASSVYLMIAWLAGVKIRIAQTHLTQTKSSLKGKILGSLLKPLLFASVNYKYACGNDAFKHMWGNCKDKYIMTNAIEVKNFLYSKVFSKDIRSKLQIPLDLSVIGTIGRLDQQKNPFFILKIIEELKARHFKFIFLWIGDGPLSDAVKSEAKRLEIDNLILFLGNRNDIPKYLSAMDIFILPSLYEGLPIVGVEAQANGLACLFSDTITKEVKLCDNVYYLPISDAQLWAKSIISSLNVYTNRESGIELLNMKYNIPVAAKMLEKEYLLFYKRAFG